MSAHRTLGGRVDDTEFLLKQGESPDAICQRLGTTPAALYRLLYRYGRHDLARHLNRVQRMQYPRGEHKRPKVSGSFPRSQAEARTWAVENGHQLGTKGRITRAAFDAWQTSRSDAA